jgi:hypothetical protein
MGSDDLAAHAERRLGVKPGAPRPTAGSPSRQFIVRPVPARHPRCSTARWRRLDAAPRRAAHRGAAMTRIHPRQRRARSRRGGGRAGDRARAQARNIPIRSCAPARAPWPADDRGRDQVGRITYGPDGGGVAPS